MKQFLKHIVIFSLCILVPLIAAEVYVERLPNPSRSKHRWMAAYSSSVQTLILGSSHTYYGVNPHLLPHAFNLAQVAQTYRYDYYLLRHYPMPKLKTVILPFSYFSLYEDFEHTPHDRFLAIRYRLYMDCDIHPRLSYYGFECSSVNSLVEKLKTLWQPMRSSWDELGWGTDYSYDRREAEWDNGVAAATNNTYADTTLVSYNAALLDSLMTFCSLHDIRLLLITTPVSPLFRATQSQEQNRRNERVLQELLQRHPDVVYRDYACDTRFTEHDFYDSHHLNEYGAAKLTRIIALLTE